MNAMVTSGAPPDLLSPRLAAEPLSSNCGPLPLQGRGNGSWPPLPREGEGRGEGAAAVRGLFGVGAQCQSIQSNDSPHSLIRGKYSPGRRPAAVALEEAGQEAPSVG